MRQAQLRRRVALGAAICVVSLGCGRDPGPASTDVAAVPTPAPVPVAHKPARPSQAVLVAAVDQVDTDASLQALEALLRAGASLDDLRRAIVVAHGRLGAPPMQTELQAALWRLERAMPPGRQLEALLQMAARHRQALRQFGHAPAAANAPTLGTASGAPRAPAP